MHELKGTKIILASASPRRQELLRGLNIPFEVIPSDYEEIYKGEDPKEYVKKTALSKGLKILDGIDRGIIISADTIVYSNKVLEKPKDDGEAYEMIKHLSGKYHRVFTGVAVIDAFSKVTKVDSEVTKVKFRNLNLNEIEEYVKSKESLDKAGGYGIQGKGALLVESIEGCYFNVVGLPLVLLYNMLKEFGINILKG